MAVTGTVGGEANVGDTVTLNGERHQLHRHGVARAIRSRSMSRARSWSPTRTVTIQASVSSTDAAGNVGAASDTEGYTVDLTAPAPTVALTANITADDIVNAAEAGGSIAITGVVGGDAQDGDTVTLTINGADYTGTVAAGRSRSLVPGAALVADADLTIHARVDTVERHRHARQRQRQRDLHGRPHSAPTIDADLNVTADDIVNAAEAGGSVAITGTVGGEANVGRHRHLDGERHELQGTVAAGNAFSISVPGARWSADADCDDPGERDFHRCRRQRRQRVRTPRATRRT